MCQMYRFCLCFYYFANSYIFNVFIDLIFRCDKFEASFVFILKAAVLFNPFKQLTSKPASTRAAPIPIHPMFYHIMLPTSSTTTQSGTTTPTSATTTATTTPTTTVTSTTTTLPPNFCTMSADCPVGTCCRDLNNKVLLMSEVFDVTGR